MDNFIQLVIAGVITGSIYGLVALAFVVLFKATGVFNFAQAILIMLGAYLAVTAIGPLRLPWLLAIPAVLVAAGVLGALMHFVLVRPMLGQPLFSIVMVTMGVSLVIDAVAILVYHGAVYPFPSPVPDQTFRFAGLHISLLAIVVFAISVACMGLFGLAFQWSRIGLQMRATSESYEAALISGVNADRVFMVAWAFSVAVTALGGVLLASLIGVASADLQGVGQLAFPAAVIGGMRSVPGSIVGGLIVGVLQLLGEGYLSPEVGDVAVYGALLAILLIRPWGLFGSREIARG